MRLTNNKEFYLSNKWQHKQRRVLRRDGYECREAKRYGKAKSAEMVHHIYEIEYYPELAFEDWNLISLCNGNHNKMHNRTADTVTKLGLYWQQKRASEFVNYYAEHIECVDEIVVEKMKQLNVYQKYLDKI